MTRSEFDRNYTSRFNPQQLEAVHAVDGAVLLLAVPGSGKTTVLVTRLGYMLCCCGISPDAILTMTYTKAATREMQKRFVRLFGQDCPQVPEIRTINGVSSKIIDFYTRTHGSGSAFTVAEMKENWQNHFRSVPGAQRRVRHTERDQGASQGDRLCEEHDAWQREYR